MLSTPEEVRRATLDEIEWILNSAPGHIFIPEDTRRLLKAHRDYWAQDDGVQLSRLFAILQREP